MTAVAAERRPGEPHGLYCVLRNESDRTVFYVELARGCPARSDEEQGKDGWSDGQLVDTSCMGLDLTFAPVPPHSAQLVFFIGLGPGVERRARLPLYAGNDFDPMDPQQGELLEVVSTGPVQVSALMPGDDSLFKLVASGLPLPVELTSLR